MYCDMKVKQETYLFPSKHAWIKLLNLEHWKVRLIAKRIGVQNAPHFLLKKD